MEKTSVQEYLGRNCETSSEKYILEGEEEIGRIKSVESSDGHEVFLSFVYVNRGPVNEKNIRIIIDGSHQGYDYRVSSYHPNKEKEIFFSEFENIRGKSLSLDEIIKEISSCDDKIQRSYD